MAAGTKRASGGARRRAPAGAVESCAVCLLPKETMAEGSWLQTLRTSECRGSDGARAPCPLTRPTFCTRGLPYNTCFAKQNRRAQPSCREFCRVSAMSLGGDRPRPTQDVRRCHGMFLHAPRQLAEIAEHGTPVCVHGPSLVLVPAGSVMAWEPDGGQPGGSPRSGRKSGARGSCGVVRTGKGAHCWGSHGDGSHCRNSRGCRVGGSRAGSASARGLELGGGHSGRASFGPLHSRAHPASEGSAQHIVDP